MSDLEFVFTRDVSQRINEVDIDGEEDLVIRANFIGQYAAATIEEPAEYPELEFEAIDVYGQSACLSSRDEETVTQMCWDRYDELGESGYFEDEDSAYERARQSELDNE